MVMTKNMQTKDAKEGVEAYIKREPLTGPYNHVSSKTIEYEDEYLRNILSNTKTIAMIGLSPDENRPSNFAAKYLQMKGYRVIPINPVTKRKYILKEKVYSSLFDLNFKPDMVDIFIKNEKLTYNK